MLKLILIGAVALLAALIALAVSLLLIFGPVGEEKAGYVKVA